MTRRALTALVVASLAAAACSDTVASPDAAPDAAPDAPPDVDVACAPGRARCGEACVDTATDGAHCGACGAACSALQECRGGRCRARCAPPEVSCAGADGAEVCIDTAADPAHCGACGRACAADEACVAGGCALRCARGLVACAGACRSLGSDRAHCGACGNACAAGQACLNGACETPCPADQTNCGGACVDARADARHCGACGMACAAGQRCDAGRCAAPPCGPDDTTDGRCDGAAVVRCVEGGLARAPCAVGEACSPAAAGSPARCVVPAGRFRLAGTVTYEMRPVSPTGVGALRAAPAAGVPVQVIDASGAPLAQGVTDAAGAYALLYPAEAGAMVRLRAVTARSDGRYNFAVRDGSGATHAFTSPAFPAAPEGARALAVTEPTNAGALAVYDTVRRAFDRMAPYLPERPVLLYVAWERGRAFSTTASSYFSPASNTIFVNGSSTDPDEFDPAVIAHEFGHYYQRRYSRESSPGGRHDGSPTDPNLAFSEGFATFVSTLVTGTSYYIDAGATRLRIVRNLAALPLSRNFMGDPATGLDQPVGEYLVAGTQYALFAAGADRTTQTARALRVMREYLPRSPAPDRAEAGVDLVDFLDGYLCVNAEADRATIDRYLVRDRRFPYDFDWRPLCPRPEARP